MHINRPFGLRAICAACSILALSSALAADSFGPPPPSRVVPVVDNYFGTKVSDPYRWMEDMKSQDFIQWAKQQADYANAMLEQIPGRAKLKARLTELSDASATISDIETAANQLFYLKTEPGRDGKRLYWRDSTTGTDKLLVDPDTMQPAGAHYAIDYFYPAPNGKLLAVGISQGGSENSTLRIMNVNDGTWLPDAIDRAGLNSEGIGWRPDSTGFLYNRVPAADAKGVQERYDKSALFEHVLGRAVESDKPIFGYGVDPKRGFAISDLPHVVTSPASRHALAMVLHGDAVERSLYVVALDKIDGPNTPWQRIAGPGDQVSDAVLHGDKLFLISHKNAPRHKVLQLDLAHPDIAKATTIVPAGKAVVRKLAAASNALYVRTMEGGVSRLLQVTYAKGKQAATKKIAMPFDGAMLELITDPVQPGALMKLEGWTHSPAYFGIDTASGESFDSELLPPSSVDFSQMASKEVMVKSYDGTMVPLSIIYRKDIKRDGKNPSILTGYGAYGITMEAKFKPGNLAWLERGGVLAIAHVRGGGEFGEEWHRAAHIQTKANSVRDFIACAEYLVREGYTSPKKLAGIGGSAGGITIGAALNQRPDLFAVAQSSVSLSDMLRMELTPNGPPNIAEFGTVTKKQDFTALYALSPYHQVKDGTAYPAVIVTTGMNDPRVEAWLPAKFAARLQAASTSHKPVILRIDYDAGHGMGSTKAQNVAENADVMSFFLWQMGMEEFQPVKTAE